VLLFSGNTARNNVIVGQLNVMLPQLHSYDNYNQTKSFSAEVIGANEYDGLVINNFRYKQKLSRCND
jgi:hypothetical protein